MFDPYHYYKRKTKSSRKGQILQKKVALKSADSHAYPLLSVDYWGKILIANADFVREVVKQKVEVRNINLAKTIDTVLKPFYFANPYSFMINTLGDMVKKTREIWGYNQDKSLLDETKRLIDTITDIYNNVSSIYYKLVKGAITIRDANYLNYQDNIRHLLQFNQAHRAIEWHPPNANRINLQEVVDVTSHTMEYNIIDGWTGSIPETYYNPDYTLQPLDGNETQLNWDDSNLMNYGFTYNFNRSATYLFAPWSLLVQGENVIPFLSEQYFPPIEGEDTPFWEYRLNDQEDWDGSDLEINAKFTFLINITYIIIKP